MVCLLQTVRLFLQAGLCLFFAVAAAAAAPAQAEKGYVGLALGRDACSDLPTVTYVATQGPAAGAGVQLADAIAAVDGTPTTGQPLARVTRSIDGPAGTPVQLSLRRAGVPDRSISVVRRPFVEAYTPAADAGDPKAAYRLGLFYERAPDSTRDMSKAAGWYRRAAEGNEAPAQLKLGEFAADGLGMAKDLAAAAGWYRRAAKQEDAAAQRELALCYRRGDGVTRSDTDAFYWFQRSARQDDAVAELNLGYFYREGRGVARDDRAAFAWYYRSAAQDEASAQARVANAYLKGHGVAQDDQAAFAWYYRSAMLNDPYGQSGLAYLYASGRGTRRDQATALQWYVKASENLPDDRAFKEDVALARLRLLSNDPASFATLDLSTLPASVKTRFVRLFYVLATFYLLGGIALLWLSFRKSDAAERFSLALGWLVFFLESQGVAFFGLCLLGTAAGAGTLVGIMSILGALPVILSSCGPARAHFWRAPTVSPVKMLLYGLGAVAAMTVVAYGYHGIYWLAMHSRLPSQPTAPLLAKAKAASAWLTCASATLLLPVTEEILFRGYLFGAVRRRWSARPAIVVTALVFSAVHFQWLYFVPLVGFGLILGWVRAKTGSLWLPVLIHVVNNGLAFFAI